MQADLFDQIPLFEGLTPTQNSLLRPLFTPCECHAGMVIFEQGAPASCLYLVVTGEVNVRYKPEDGPAIILVRVRPGGLVGWSAALGRQEYTSSALCALDSLVLRVRGEDLRNLCEQDPEIGELVLKRLADAIADRLSNTNEHVIDLLKQGLAYGH